MIRFVLLGLLGMLRLAFATTAASVDAQLQQVALDPDACYRVVELNFAKEDLKVYLTSGYLMFSKPVAGLRMGAVFVTSADAGDAEVLLLPPTRSERASLAAFTGSPNLEEHLRAAVFVFTDNTSQELFSRVDSNPVFKKSPEAAALIASQWASALQNLSDSFSTRLVHDLLSENRRTGLFYMAVQGNQLGNFDLLYDPTSADQISAGKLSIRNDRTFFDTWTSFPSRSFRNSSPLDGNQFTLENFRIEATIDGALGMKAVTRATLRVDQASGRALPFYISRSVRVTGVRIDGAAAEVFERETARATAMFRGDDRQFLVIPATPLEPSKPHEVEFQHEGEVIQQAGDGVYYVTSRGTWYPRTGTEMAKYELTFRYPKNLVLVATGTSVEEKSDANWRISRRITEIPVRLAGFNLGEFRSVTNDHAGYRIELYANRSLERALEPMPPPMPPPPAPRARRGMEIGGPTTIMLPTRRADPAARTSALMSDVIATLDFMTAQFGPAPLRNLAVTPIPGRFGQGFPGLIYLSTLSYMDPDQRPHNLQDRTEETFFSDLLQIHEIAHQWWGNLVASAGNHDAWLIESLANYTALLLVEKKKGARTVEGILDQYKQHLLTKGDDGRSMESAGPITWGYRLESSLAPNAWQGVTYEKGTWIMHMLRRRMGDQHFLSLLREICTRYRFKSINTEQFRELAAEFMPAQVADRSLKSFFENWVYGTGIPAVKITYAVNGLKVTGTVSQRDVSEDFATLVPLEIQSGRLKSIHWLPTGAEPVPFSLTLKTPVTKVALLANDALITTPK